MRRLVLSFVLLSNLAAAADEEPLRITHGPYLQLPGATSMTLVWHTDRPCVSWVEYGVDEALGRRADIVRHGLIANDSTHHTARITGLEPGVTYHYRVGSRAFLGYEQQHIVSFGETVYSEPATFTTLSPGRDAFSFVAFSDIHDHTAHLDAMLAELAVNVGVEAGRGFPADLVFYNGDMIDAYMVEDQPLRSFVDVSVQRFAREIPFIFVRGNHDVRGRHARRLEEDFPSVDGRAYFSFDQGPVHFVVLDTGEDKPDSHEYYNGLVAFEPYRKAEAEWLRRDLQSAAAAEALFTVVISHIPPRGHDSPVARQMQALFEPLANAAGVDLWISGHLHRVMRIDPAAGANAYTLVVGAPDTCTYVDASYDELHVRVFRKGSEELDRVTLEPRGDG